MVDHILNGGSSLIRDRGALLRCIEAIELEIYHMSMKNSEEIFDDADDSIRSDWV